MQADAEVYDPEGDGTKLSADDTELTTPAERRPCGQEQRQWNGSTPYTSGCVVGLLTLSLDYM